MPDADFFSFLSASVDRLRAESGANFAKLTREMGDLRAEVSASGIRNYVYFEAGRLMIEPDSASHDIEVKLDDRAVLDLIDGKWSLHQCILEGGIEIKASPAVLDRYSRCLGIYLNGALRSQGFPKLLSQYRSAVFSFG